MATQLTALQIDALKTPGKYRVGGEDCGGLYVEVSKAGGKVFRLKYRLDDKENRYTIEPPYPQTGVREAREQARWARAQIKQGLHPKAVRDAAAEKARQAVVLAQENVFRVVAERYLNK
ncbi:integrase, partial [Pseudomonas monteilii]